MEKYQRVPRERDPIKANEIRVSASGSLNAYIDDAMKLLSTDGMRTIIIKATGRATMKAVMVAESLKLKLSKIPLYQISKIGSMPITDMYVPLEEGLDNVTHERIVCYLEILLSKDKLNENDPGYQDPITDHEVKNSQGTLVSSNHINGTIESISQSTRGDTFDASNREYSNRRRGGSSGSVTRGFRGRGRVFHRKMSSNMRGRNEGIDSYRGTKGGDVTNGVGYYGGARKSSYRDDYGGGYNVGRGRGSSSDYRGGGRGGNYRIDGRGGNRGVSRVENHLDSQGVDDVRGGNRSFSRGGGRGGPRGGRGGMRGGSRGRGRGYRGSL